MPSAAELFERYRIAALALAVSAGVHAAVFVGMPPRVEAIDEQPGADYSASLDPLAAEASIAPAPSPAPRAAPRRAARARPRMALAPEPLMEPIAASDVLAAAAPSMVEPVISPEPAEPAPEAKPDVVAMAQPAAPIPALEPPRFPTQALPANISITYSLTSSFARAARSTTGAATATATPSRARRRRSDSSRSSSRAASCRRAAAR